jgi:hypothetical protein
VSRDRIDVHAHDLPVPYRDAAAGQAQPDGIPALPEWNQALAMDAMDKLEGVAPGGVAPLFAGAGAISVDERVSGRSRWPARISLGLLVIAIAVALLTGIVLNGTNPIDFEAPANWAERPKATRR